jgi:hypothetical protein
MKAKTGVIWLKKTEGKDRAHPCLPGYHPFPVPGASETPFELQEKQFPSSYVGQFPQIKPFEIDLSCATLV